MMIKIIIAVGAICFGIYFFLLSIRNKKDLIDLYGKKSALKRVKYLRLSALITLIFGIILILLFL